MKYAIRILTTLLFLASISCLVYLSIENHRSNEEVKRLEGELGKMEIRDTDRIHIVEIASPVIPPEIADHVDFVWQFRCYLPPNYQYVKLTGGGQVTKDGLFQLGGSSSSWGSPRSEPIHGLMTISIAKQRKSQQVYYSFCGSSSTTSWQGFDPDRVDKLVVQKLVSSAEGARSFDQETILPLLKLYDPDTAKDTKLAGKSLTTYSGGMIVLYPKSLENEMNQLRRGETPPDFDLARIAKEVGDE